MTNKTEGLLRYFKNFSSYRMSATKRKSTDSEDDECVAKKSKPKAQGHWSKGLLAVMDDPECVVQEDDKVVVIKDKYPKARYHFLILPKEDVASLNSVTSEHVELLRYMHKVAEELAATYHDKAFKIGYHAQASLYRLHLHLISDDMNSPCLKTKKHWNSFVTDFFLDSKELCDSLESEGKVTLPSAETCKELLDTPLKCHKCDYEPKHMPDLKQHILKHEK